MFIYIHTTFSANSSPRLLVRLLVGSSLQYVNAGQMKIVALSCKWLWQTYCSFSTLTMLFPIGLFVYLDCAVRMKKCVKCQVKITRKISTGNEPLWYSKRVYWVSIKTKRVAFIVSHTTAFTFFIQCSVLFTISYLVLHFDVASRLGFRTLRF